MIYLTSVHGRIDQGDILFPIRIKDHIPWWIDENDYPVVVLTPTCDIAQDKVSYHRIAVLKPFALFFVDICQEILGDRLDRSKVSRNNRERITSKLDRAIRNAWPRFHFLPKQDLFTVDKIIDFEIVASVPIEVFSSEIRIARLASPYREELIHRYSHHSMRIGTEDLPKDMIAQIIGDCFNLHQGS